MKTLPLFPPESGDMECLVDRVVDGDTFDVCLFYPVRVRLWGVQVAEKNTEKGAAIMKSLAERLTHQVVGLKLRGRDKYGRMLASIATAAGDLAGQLVQDGAAVAWDGTGPRPFGTTMRKTFAYHKPSADGLEKITKLREAFSQIAELIESTCPMSRERSIAMTELETTAMWAIKSVVCNDQGSEVG